MQHPNGFEGPPDYGKDHQRYIASLQPSLAVIQATQKPVQVFAVSAAPNTSYVPEGAKPLDAAYNREQARLAKFPNPMPIEQALALQAALTSKIGLF